MGLPLTAAALEDFLTEIGRRLTGDSKLVLLGGSALLLLGHSRPTSDVDYEGAEHEISVFRELLNHVAMERQIEVEAVPIEQFVPIPTGADERHIPVGNFGRLQVLVLDPYSIALSKIDRGLDSDLEDVAFLIRRGYVVFDRLSEVIDKASAQSVEFDLDPAQMRIHLELVERALNEK